MFFRNFTEVQDLRRQNHELQLRLSAIEAAAVAKDAPKRQMPPRQMADPDFDVLSENVTAEFFHDAKSCKEFSRKVFCSIFRNTVDYTTKFSSYQASQLAKLTFIERAVNKYYPTTTRSDQKKNWADCRQTLCELRWKREKLLDHQHAYLKYNTETHTTKVCHYQTT